MVLSIQQDVLSFQIVVEQWRGHVMEEVNPQSDFIQNAKPQWPGHHRVHVFLQNKREQSNIIRKLIKKISGQEATSFTPGIN